MIFVDLDEVLSDFRGAALAAHGVSSREFQARYWHPNMPWGMARAMGISDDEFWAPINRKGMAFWTGLRPLPWFEQMMEALADFEWYIVSSPSRGTDSRFGKIIWVQTWLPRMLDRLFLTSHKYLLAAPGRILIDDCPANVDQFRLYGGEAILFPSIGNDLHAKAGDPVTYIKEQLHASSLP